MRIGLQTAYDTEGLEGGSKVRLLHSEILPQKKKKKKKLKKQNNKHSFKV